MQLNIFLIKSNANKRGQVSWTYQEDTSALERRLDSQHLAGPVLRRLDRQKCISSHQIVV